MSEANEIFKKIRDVGIVPVIKLDKVSDAVPLAKALAAGGIPIAEITYRTAAAADSIRAVCKECPEMLVGAGTVTSVEQAKSAIAAGAKFVLAPGFDGEVVDYCLAQGIPMIPGVSGASQIEAAMTRGLKLVKLFPASVLGGPAMIKALGGPFPDMTFLPTGGVSTENLVEYAKLPNVLAVGGSWMVKPDMISSGRWDLITSESRKAELAIQGFSIAHVGINATESESAEKIAGMISLFGFPEIPGEKSIFNNKEFEVMRKNGRGKHGHVGIRTANVDRALAYLGACGFTPVEETATHIITDDKSSPLKFVYLLPEIGGFAFHLVRY